jgi:hypothetical protein
MLGLEPANPWVYEGKKEMEMSNLRLGNIGYGDLLSSAKTHPGETFGTQIPTGGDF